MTPVKMSQKLNFKIEILSPEEAYREKILYTCTRNVLKKYLVIRSYRYPCASKTSNKVQAMNYITKCS